MKIQGLMYSPIVKPQVFTSDVDKDIDKNMSLLNKIKPKLKLTSYELMEDFAKKFNWSVEEMVKESGFETVDDFLKQNYRNYTYEEGMEPEKDEKAKNHCFGSIFLS